ncbi:hypothetical protein TSAR_000963 [Trichomalopsis sarcophagae]|uniref:DUF659 domain-containing protein n=1 Tax=Trichomalopsis sarcophagae TaxID=543379 RepID=A0A232EMQ3_9HYME|nr:hypothetical protein TSAR_000963 [Trichomalopsis sarcophagae]
MQLTPTTPTSSKKCQTRIDTTFGIQKSFQDGGTRYTEAINRLPFMIAKDKIPYSTVENEGFETFVKYVAPLFKVPSRLTVTRLMQNKYDVLSEIIKTELSTVQSISLTADIWTDTLNNKSYIGVTYHYIFGNKHKSIMIGVTELTDHHTADNIKSWLLTIVQDWHINMDSIVAFVSDNAANIKKAIIDEFGIDKWLPCLTHTLNLIPAKLIKTDMISSVHSKVKGIVKYFKQSVLDALRLVSDLMLIQSVDTRWNSSHDMYERFVLLSDKIAPILLKSSSAPEILSGSELKIIKEFVELLRTFKEATKIVSGEKYVTDLLDLDTDLVRQMKKLLTEDYMYRLGKIESMPTIAMATILDPRFKRLYFSDKLASSSAVNKITKLLNNAILESSKASCENNLDSS